MSELVRFSRNAPRGSDLVVGAGSGRGAWLCADHPVECLDLAIKRRTVGRALRAEVSGGDLDRLRAKLSSTTGENELQ